MLETPFTGGTTPVVSFKTDNVSKLLDEESAMNLALEEATSAMSHGDVPVGAVAMVDGRVIASRHNERELQSDPTAHAEILALRDAAAIVGSWRLDSVTLIVTLEPCAMCAGALIVARIKKVVFSAEDPKAGACGSLYNLCSDPRLNHEVDVRQISDDGRSAELLKTFFQAKRRETGTS